MFKILILVHQNILTDQDSINFESVRIYYYYGLHSLRIGREKLLAFSDGLSHTADLAAALATLAAPRGSSGLRPADVLVAFETRQHVPQADFFEAAGFEVTELRLPEEVFASVWSRDLEGELGKGAAHKVKVAMLRLKPLPGGCKLWHQMPRLFYRLTNPLNVFVM